MRKLVLAAVMATAAAPFALPAPAAAQGPNEARARQDCRHDINQARNRDWRQYNRYDWNSYEPGNNGYYAEDYYRDGRYYRERRLSANDRVYLGRDNRYYCRRSDGTTGLIIGATAGALIGHSLDDSRSGLLGTIIGAAAGGAIGSSIDRDSSNRNLRCR